MVTMHTISNNLSLSHYAYLPRQSNSFLVKTTYDSRHAQSNLTYTHIKSFLYMSSHSDYHAKYTLSHTMLSHSCSCIKSELLQL